MDLHAMVKRGWQKNFANGEFGKHWKVYTALFLAGMLYQSCRADDAHGYELKPATAVTQPCHEQRPTLEYLAQRRTE